MSKLKKETTLISTETVEDAGVDILCNGHSWHLKFVDPDDTEFVMACKPFLTQHNENYAVMGLTCVLPQTVYVRTDMHIDQINHTITHELTHVLCKSYGYNTDDMDEEDLCEFIAANIGWIIEACNTAIDHYNQFANDCEDFLECEDDLDEKGE